MNGECACEIAMAVINYTLLTILRISQTNGLTSQQCQLRLQWWLQQLSSNNKGSDPISRRVVLVASSGAGRF
jgi:hypothetical protein